MFETQILIDADEGPTGWEVAIRFGADDLEAAWTDLTDEQLRNMATQIGTTVVEAIVADRDRQKGA